jgi:hypothetical protein
MNLNTQGLYNNLENDLNKFGGILRCEVCGYEEPLNNVGYQLKNGWKKCCGLTMRWITENELKSK